MTWGRSTGLTVSVAVALGLNSAYLALRHDPTLFYFGNIVAHLALGLALAATAGPTARRAFRGLHPVDKAAALALFGAGALGLVLMVTGTPRAYRPLLWVHIALGATGGALLLARAAAGALAWIPRPALGRGLAIAALAGAALTPAFRYYADHIAPNGRPIVNPKLAPLSMEGEGAGPASPFFPSSADTNTKSTIPANVLHDERDLRALPQGHLRPVELVGAPLLVVQQPVVPQVDRVHAGRRGHEADASGAPAATTTRCFFNGRFDRPIKEQIDTPEAQAGLGCTSCHSIVHVREHDGAGRLRRSSTRRCTTWR